MATAKHSEVIGGDDHPVKDSMYDLLRPGFEINPDAPAIVSTWQDSNHLSDLVDGPHPNPGGPDCLCWSYRQLNDVSLRLATFIRNAHRTETPRVATFVRNSIEYYLTYCAVAHLRGTLIPLDMDMLEPAREDDLKHRLTLLKPDVVITDHVDDSIRTRLADLPGTVYLTLDDRPSHITGWTTFRDAIQSTHASKSMDTLEHDKPANGNNSCTILLTSGSTSLPKPVGRSAHMYTNTMMMAFRNHVAKSDIRFVVSTANFRAINAAITFDCFLSGGVLVLADPSFTAKAILKCISSYGITLLGSYPTQIRAMRTEKSVDRHLNTSSLEYVFVGGDVVSSDILDEARNIFPSAHCLCIMGQTETLMTLSHIKQGSTKPVTQADMTFLPSGVAGAGSAGPGNAVRICAHGTHDVVPRGEAGDLVLTGQGVLTGYLDGRDADNFFDGPDLTGRTRRWFRSGDWAQMDDAGCVYVCGRYKDVIARHAVKLSPVAIEVCLASLGVEAVVFGMDSETEGSVPVAVVKTLNGKQKDELANEVGRKLGKEHRLARVIELSELGLDSWLERSIKVSKSDLRERVLEMDAKGQGQTMKKKDSIHQ